MRLSKIIIALVTYFAISCDGGDEEGFDLEIRPDEIADPGAIISVDGLSPVPETYVVPDVTVPENPQTHQPSKSNPNGVWGDR